MKTGDCLGLIVSQGNHKGFINLNSYTWSVVLVSISNPGFLIHLQKERVRNYFDVLFLKSAQV